MKKIINPLAALPRHIVKSSKNWFTNTRTGQRIHKDKITDHLPKVATSQSHEQIIAKRWDLHK
jgi:hypothetical protein